MRACVQRTETWPEGVRGTGKEPERGERTATLTTGERVLHRVVFLFSFFFLFHTQNLIFITIIFVSYIIRALYHYGRPEWNNAHSVVWQLRVRAIQMLVFSRAIRILYKIYILTQYIIPCTHCITPEITQQRW